MPRFVICPDADQMQIADLGEWLQSPGAELGVVKSVSWQYYGMHEMMGTR